MPSVYLGSAPAPKAADKFGKQIARHIHDKHMAYVWPLCSSELRLTRVHLAQQVSQGLKHFSRFLVVRRTSFQLSSAVEYSTRRFQISTTAPQSPHELKYTTRNPIQLPTTPTAEYELVNINGRNS